MAVDLGSSQPTPAPASPVRARPRLRLRPGHARHLLALPSVAWTVLFFFAPLGLLLLYSFGTTNLLTYQVGFGWTLSNYTGIFQQLYLDSVLRSFALSLVATVACLLIGFPVAYTISRSSGRRQALLLLAVMIPFWTSFVVRTYGIYNVISYNGPLYQLLHGLGLVHGYIHLLFTPIGVGIGIVYTYLPLMILPLLSHWSESTRRSWRRRAISALRLTACCGASRCRSRSPGSSPAASWWRFRPPAST